MYSALSSHESRDVWYVDSGCSNNMTKNKSCFVQLDETIKSKVTLGDGNVQIVEGKGTIVVKTQNGSKKYIHDVFYVPGLTQNLLNVGFFSCEPQKFEEALKEEVWRKAMDEEIKMIEKNHTWELMQKPEDKEIIGLKWVYKIKYNEDGTIQKHKA